MSVGSIPEYVIVKLRGLYIQVKEFEHFKDIQASKKLAIPRFQKVFSLNNIPRLTEEEFAPFLHYEENGHWTYLYRNKSRLLSDISRLRKGLAILVDESLPVSDRLSRSVDIIYGMREGLATAILMIISPNKYGVWNGKSKDALKALHLWPQFEWGLSIGGKYLKVNKVLREMKTRLGLDFWTNDALLGVAFEQGLLVYGPKKRRG